MIFLFDKNLKLLDEIDNTISLGDTAELNGQISATISYKYDLYREEFKYFGYKADGTFYIFKIINMIKSKNIITFTGIHIFFDELKGVIVRDKRPSNVSAAVAMNIALEGTNWAVESSVTGINSINFYYINCLKAFYDVIEKWQCEFKLKLEIGENGTVSRKVVISDSVAKDNGKWFEYGDKLLTVVAEESLSDTYTAFIGRGKGEQTATGGYGRKLDFKSVEWKIAEGKPLNKPIGQDFIEFPTATEIYGYPGGKPKITTVEFDDIEDPEKLLQATYEYGLKASRPKLQLKATALSDDRVEVGEVAAVVRPDLNIRYKTRIFKVKTNRLKNTQEFEFGDKIKQSTSDRIKADIKNTEKIKEDIESVKSKIIAQVTNYYFNEDGYNYELKVGNEYNLPAGYYSFNKPIDQEPTKVVYMGAGKILISNEKGPDKAWIWQTALTGEGVAGESIITNSITGNKLSSDVGQSLDLSSNESINSIVEKTISLEAGLEDSTKQAQDSIEAIRSELSQKADELELKFTTENESLSEELKNLLTYFRWGQDGAIIGKSGSPIVLHQSNDKIEFLEGDKVIASWERGTMSVDNLIALIQIQIGQHVVETYESTNTLVGISTIVRQV